MLQWMGGSRRKIKEARNSVQARQRQFFEHRRKQVKHAEATTAAGSQCPNDGGEKHKSLDLLSLISLCPEPARRSDSGDGDVAANPREDFQLHEVRDLDTQKMSVLPGSATSQQYETLEKQQDLQSDLVVLDTQQPQEPETQQDHLRQASPIPVQKADASLIRQTPAVRERRLPARKPIGMETQAPRTLLNFISDDDGEEGLEGNEELYASFNLQGTGQVRAYSPVHSPSM